MPPFGRMAAKKKTTSIAARCRRHFNMHHPLPRVAPLAALLLAACATAPAPAAPTDPKTLTTAFEAALAAKPAAFPDAPLTKAGVAAEKAKQWAAYKAAATTLGWDKNPVAWPAPLDPAAKQQSVPVGSLPCDAETMRYALMTKGAAGTNGWPLFFQTHGGGSTDEKLSGPHGWAVNTRDWQVQGQIVAAMFPSGRYFIPRMANDNKGRWWFKHNHTAFDAVIKRGVLFHGIDPDRVYMMGISEGAYGTEALLPFWADRFAGGCAMAGGAGGGERLACLRNTPLRNDTGEHDTMFGRAKLAKEEHDWLEKLRQADPAGYDHALNMQKDRGHSIDYAPGPAWIAQKTRNPRPDKVVWFNHALDGVRRTDFAWLALSKAPARDALITAQTDRKANTVTVTAMMNPPDAKNESPVYADKPPEVGVRVPLSGTDLIVHLDDALLDLDKEVAVIVNGKQAFKGKVARSPRVLAETLANTGDPGRVFSGRVVVKME